MNGSVKVSIVAAVLVLAGARLEASELSYSFVDFGAVNVDGGVEGTKAPTPGQLVTIESGEGDGLTVAGSLAVGQRFYLAASYESSIVDVDALISSPLATVSTGGNFDYIATRAALGYFVPLGEELDLFFEVSYDGADYDFGSFAGENFDADAAGAGAGVGLRWNPTPSLEVFAAARSSAVGEVNLTTSEFDQGVQASLGLRVYFFSDLGLAVDLRSGDVNTLAVSLRFGFGELRAGRN